MNLHIVMNPVERDSRVLKETRTIADAGLFERVEIVGLAGHGMQEYLEFDGLRAWRIPLRTRELPKDVLSQILKYAEWRHQIVRRYRTAALSVVHSHDLEPLPIAVRLKQLTGARLVYDAHELETERLRSRGVRKRLMQHTENRCMKWVDAMITVSPSIQRWYQERYPDTSVTLVRNVPVPPSEGLRPVALRERLKIPSDALLFIYQGGHVPGRGIEAILTAFSAPDMQHHIVFMGDGPLSEQVRRMASELDNIHWIPPVPPASVVATTAGADIGFSMTEDVALNHRYCLPNKLFEYWIAGIPVVVSETPDQAHLVNEYEAGWIAPATNDEFVRMLNSLRERDLDRARDGVRRLTGSISWENEGRQLLGVYQHVLAR